MTRTEMPVAHTAQKTSKAHISDTHTATSPLRQHHDEWMRLAQAVGALSHLALAHTHTHTSVTHAHMHAPKTASANLLDGQDVYCRVECPEGRADGLRVNLVIVILVVVLEDVCKICLQLVTCSNPQMSQYVNDWHCMPWV